MTCTRRRFLALAPGLALLPGVGSVAGCVSPSPGRRSRPRCVPKESLASHSRIDAAVLSYEDNGKDMAFSFEPGFHDQLVRWFGYWQRTAKAETVDRIRSYGAWTDGGTACGSWHNSGRAFDIARLLGPSGEVVSCRKDLWGALGQAALAQRRRGYWALAASLHLHFAYVLTYLFDDLHANHIHVDNGVSGSELSTFNPRSRVQVQMVQAASSYLWGRDCELTGVWDAQTKRASREVLSGLGNRGDLTQTENWHAFLDASARR